MAASGRSRGNGCRNHCRTLHFASFHLDTRDLLFAFQESVEISCSLEFVLLCFFLRLLVVERFARLCHFSLNVFLRSLLWRNYRRFLDLTNGILIHLRTHFLIGNLSLSLQESIEIGCSLEPVLLLCLLLRLLVVEGIARLCHLLLDIRLCSLLWRNYRRFLDLTNCVLIHLRAHFLTRDLLFAFQESVEIGCSLEPVLLCFFLRLLVVERFARLCHFSLNIFLCSLLRRNYRRFLDLTNLTICHFF